MYPTFDRNIHQCPINRERPDWIDSGQQSARCPEHPTLAICARNCDVMNLETGVILEEVIIANVRCIEYRDAANMKRTVPIMNLYATALIPRDWLWCYIRFVNGNHNDIRINNVSWVKMPIEDSLYASEIISLCSVGNGTTIVTLWDGLETHVTVKMMSLALGLDEATMSYRLNNVLSNNYDMHLATCIVTDGHRITDVQQTYSFGIETILNYFKTFVNIDVEEFSLFEDTLYAGNNTDFIIYN